MPQVAPQGGSFVPDASFPTNSAAGACARTLRGAPKKATRTVGWRGLIQVCSELDVVGEGAGTGRGVSKRPWRPWRMGTIWSGKRTWNGWKAGTIEESGRCV